MQCKASLMLALSFVPLTPMLGASSEDASPVNTIRAIRAVPRGVEIEVHSTRPFPVRTVPAVLRVGDAEFVRSRYPKGSGLDALVFLLRGEEFDALATGDAVFVVYGKGEEADPGTTWEFARLDKSLLQAVGNAR